MLTFALISFASSGKVKVKSVFRAFMRAMLLELFLYFQDKSRDAQSIDYILLPIWIGALPEGQNDRYPRDMTSQR